MAIAEKKPKLIDYFAGAILTNGLASVAIYLAAFHVLLPVYSSSPSGSSPRAIATYLVCMRTSKQHLLTGAKTAVVSIILGVIMVPTTTGT